MSTTEWITILGVLTGLLGTASALVSSLTTYLTFKQEGYVIKVRGKRGWSLMNAVPPYSDDKLYSVITVYNRGRRHANISKVGEASLYYFGGSIYSDSMIYGTTKLEDDGARDYLAEENQNKVRPATGYYYAVTQSGKMFKYYPRTRLIYWLCYPMRKTRWMYSRIKKITNRKVSKKKS